MRKYFNITFLLFVTLLLSPFSTDSYAVEKSAVKKFAEVKPDKALIYLIRPTYFRGRAVTEFIFSDQTFLGVLANNTYTYAYVEPGKHLIWNNWTFISQTEFIAGKTYFLQTFDDEQMLSEGRGMGLIKFEISHYITPTKGEQVRARFFIRHRYEKIIKKIEQLRRYNLL